MARANYLNVLKWPIITYLIGGLVFTAGVLVAPAIEKMLPVEAPFILYLVFGIWTGYKMVETGGKYYDGLIAGVIVGVVIGLFEVVVSVMSGMSANMASEFVFALVWTIGGAIIGAGYRSTK